jgi:cytochrome c-type biogenesis protein CcmH/NrfG
MPRQTAYLIAVLCLFVGFLIGTLTAAYFLPGGRKQHAVQQPPQSQSQNAQVNPAKQRRQLDLEMETSRNPDNLEAWTSLGHLYFDMDNHAEAIRAYTRALDLDPNNADIWTDLGVMYRRHGQPQKAVECFEKAVQSSPAHQTARFNMGIVLLHDLNQKKQAIATWKELLEINPDAKAPTGTPLHLMIEQIPQE